ncbi:hypothetical protein GCM10020216_094920 [Nonomuraea helvata]
MLMQFLEEALLPQPSTPDSPEPERPPEEPATSPAPVTAPAMRRSLMGRSHGRHQQLSYRSHRRPSRRPALRDVGFAASVAMAVPERRTGSVIEDGHETLPP